MLHANLSRRKTLFWARAPNCRQSTRRHRTGNADLALTPHFRARNRRALFVQKPNPTGDKQKTLRLSPARNTFIVAAIVAQDGR